MKRLIAFLIFVSAIVPFSSVIAAAQPYFEPWNYGIKDNEMFVSLMMVRTDSLYFEGPEGTKVFFNGDPTGWKPKEGILKDGFFICSAEKGYIFPKGQKVIFYVFTSNDWYLPGNIFGMIANNNTDVVSNSDYTGYNFSVLPVFDKLKPTSFDSTHYGAGNGRIFISEEMVSFAGGTSVSFAGEPTSWQLKKGKLENGFFSCQADSGYVFPKEEEVVFYCVSDNGKFFPGIIMDELVNKSDTINNGKGGYNFSVTAVDSGKVVAVESEGPKVFGLFQNYPNPFNPATSINFTLPKAENIMVDIRDVTGQRVEVITDGFREAGSYSLTWNGEKFSSGVYFCTVKAGDFSQTIKMSLLK